MNHLRASLLVGAALWVAAAACTSKDSLLDEAGGASAGSPMAGSTVGHGGSSAGTGQGGSSAGTGQGGSSAGRPASSGGTSAGGSAQAGSGAGTGTVGGTGPSGGSSNGGSSNGGSGGTANGPSVGGGGSGTGGTSAGAAGDPMGGAAGATVCSDVSTLDACEERTDCHSVFKDPGTCGCGLVGCCAKFSFCADGDKADCQTNHAQCEAPTPFCENPAYVVSISGVCYEGCVDPKDCAPESSPP